MLELDTRLFIMVNNSFHRPELNDALRTISKWFNGGWAYIIAVAIFLPFRPRAAWHILRNVAIPLWSASLMVEGPFKAVFRRRRPFDSVMEVIVVGKRPANWSFPSGHAATAFAGAHLLSRHLPGLRWPLYGVASLVAFSRVYLGVHYPGDVLIGSGLGIVLVRLFAKMNPLAYTEKTPEEKKETYPL